jgi:hypothetical protein
MSLFPDLLTYFQVMGPLRIDDEVEKDFLQFFE